MIFILENVRAVLDGRLPNAYEFAFKNVLARSKRLLEGWDFSTLDEQIDTLNWLIFELDEERFFPPHMNPKVVDPGQEDATLPSFIRHHMNHIELDPAMGFTWPRYFGLLGLGLVSEARVQGTLLEMAELGDELRQHVPVTLGQYAIEAIEAVCIGETLLELEAKEASVEQEVNKKISLVRSRAAVQRHAKTNALKQRFIEFYRSGKYSSRADAASRFLSGLPDEERKLLAPTNAERTLRDALRKALRDNG
jgi:hypothetical protein